jgi:acetyl-CoA acetyltransferase
VLYKSLAAPTVTSSPNWIVSTNKFFMTNNSDTPDYTQVAASAIYATTNEVSGTGWAAGGIAASALASGGADIVLALNASGSKILSWTAGNVSVATTTLTNANGGFFYADALSPKYKIIGIWFGGSNYSTVAGTFAITWSSGTIATITCAA